MDGNWNLRIDVGQVETCGNSVCGGKWSWACIRTSGKQGKGKKSKAHVRFLFHGFLLPPYRIQSPK